MKKYLVPSVVAVFGLMASSVFALSVFDITYPVSELGNCADRTACKAYCDDVQNADACLSFAKKYGISTPAVSQQVKNLPTTGPGGCKGIDECRNYCEDSAHTDECFQFGKAHGLISADQEKQFKQRSGIENVLKNGGGPGGCATPETCKTYCSDPVHLDECISFGQKNGLLSADEAVQMKQQGFKAVMEQQHGNFQGPGNCKNDDECKTFCADPANQETCINYAVDHGFMTNEEADQARKFVGQTGPGGCKGEECRTYCDDQAHADECLSFAEKNGVMSKEEADHVRQMSKISEQGGPGGCRGRDACQAFCQDPAHQKECFNFAREHNLLSQDDQQRFEESQKLNQAVSAQGGPGGCKNADDCRAYCGDPAHVTECTAFSAAQGAITPDEAEQRLKDFSQQLNGPDNNFGNMPPVNGEFPPPEENGFQGEQPNNQNQLPEDRQQEGQNPPFQNQNQNQGQPPQGAGDWHKQFQQFERQFRQGGRPGPNANGGPDNFQGQGGEDFNQGPNDRNFKGQGPDRQGQDFHGQNFQNQNGANDNRGGNSGGNFVPGKFAPSDVPQGQEQFSPEQENGDNENQGFNGGEEGVIPPNGSFPNQPGQPNQPTRINQPPGSGQNGNFPPPPPQSGTMPPPPPNSTSFPSGTTMQQPPTGSTQLPPPPTGNVSTPLLSPTPPPAPSPTSAPTPTPTPTSPAPAPAPTPAPKPTSFNFLENLNSLITGAAAVILGR